MFSLASVACTGVGVVNCCDTSGFVTVLGYVQQFLSKNYGDGEEHRLSGRILY